jgi:hypothetical protein
VLDGKGILPPAFVKHSQSRTTLSNWLKADPPAFANAGVNKKDQSLADRFDDYRKTRYDKPVHLRFMQDNLPDLEVQVRNLTFSTSIEQKRLTYLDRAIEYLRHARRPHTQARFKANAAMRPLANFQTRHLIASETRMCRMEPTSAPLERHVCLGRSMSATSLETVLFSVASRCQHVRARWRFFYLGIKLRFLVSFLASDPSLPSCTNFRALTCAES